jgi:hypothetical protein
MKFLLIPADITRPFQIVDSGADVLAAMQKAVGGFIEQIPTPTLEVHIFAHEDGIATYMSAPLFDADGDAIGVNERATLLWHQLWHGLHQQPLVGTVILTGASVDGELQDVPQAVIDAMARV